MSTIQTDEWGENFRGLGNVGVGQLKEESESNPPGGGFLKGKKCRERDRDAGVSWAFSLTVTEPGKDFEAGYFICLVNLEFLCPSYRQIRNVLDSALAWL